MHAKTPLERKEGALDELEKKIIDAIKEVGQGVSTEKIYEKLNVDSNSQRNIRHRLSKLEKAGLIEMVEAEGKNKVFKVSVKK